MNEWVLITGASSGIGRELATAFARGQFNLVLVARNEARLRGIAEELTARHGIQAKTQVCDLSEPGAPKALFEAVRETPVSILVNNAGVGQYGAFATAEVARQTEIMQVNMTALVELTHLFLQPMLARGAGKVLNVASTAAFQPGPMVNVYYASKAFVYSFSRALAEELAGSGVQVTVLCPGTTRTEFFERGGFNSHRIPLAMDARTVAEAGYHGLMRGKPVVIPGFTNKVAALLVRFIPTGMAARIVRRIHSGRGSV